MSDAAGDSAITVEQVTQIISQAKSGGANPLLVGIQIFNSLKDQATLTGSTLTLALTASAIQIPGALAPLVDGIQSAAKQGELITLTMNREIETTFNGTRIRLQQKVGFNVENGDSPALTNMTGVSAHAFLDWLDITRLQLNHEEGHLSLAVVAGGFKKTVPIN
jgi:plastocyanin domain-containing protein